MRLSLRARITLWFVVLAACLLAAFAVVLIEVVRRQAFASLDQLLRARAAASAQLVEWDDGEFELEVPPQEPFLRLESLQSGRVLFSPARPWPVLEQPGFASLTLADGSRLRQHRGVYLPRQEHPAPDAPALLVCLAISEQEVHAQQTRLLTGLGIATPLLLLLTVLAGGFLARRIAGSLARLADAAGDIGARALKRRLPRSGQEDEIDQLAGTLNATFDRLEAAFARQTRFTADAAHELKTPLSVIRSQAEVTLRRQRTPEDYRAALEEILRATIRQAETLDSLLLLARADAGQSGGEGALLQPAKLAEELRQRYASVLVARGGQLRLACDPGLWLRGDERQLRLLLDNLLSNAVRHSEGALTVDVRLFACADERLCLEVQDDGCGIPLDAQAQLFERFTRVDGARTRSTGGSGLGLSLVRAIAEQHGGEVQLTSSPGAGACFRVFFPQAEPPVGDPPLTG